MLPQSAQAAASPQPKPRPSTRQRPRDERVAKVFDLDQARQARAVRSGAAFARANGVAPSTLRGWEVRARETDLADPVRLFFESPDGLRLLHRIVVAAIVVIVLMGGSGVPLVRTFLVWCGLDRLVLAPSPSWLWPLLPQHHSVPPPPAGEAPREWVRGWGDSGTPQPSIFAPVAEAAPAAAEGPK